MKILLNLLPPEKKKETKKNERFRMIIAQGSGVIFFGFFYCCSLLGISFLLTEQLNAAKRLLVSGSESSAMREEIASYESVFRDTNAKTVKISTLLANHVSWTKLFRTLEGATPEGVLYTHLLTKNDYTITLNGTAAKSGFRWTRLAHAPTFACYCRAPPAKPPPAAAQTVAPPFLAVPSTTISISSISPVNPLSWMIVHCTRWSTLFLTPKQQG